MFPMKGLEDPKAQIGATDRENIYNPYNSNEGKPTGAWADEWSFASQQEERGRDGHYRRGAEGAMWRDLAKQQHAMNASAARRGMNPNAARAGQWASGELGMRGEALAQQLRAAEAQNRERLMAEALRRRTALELQQQQMETGQLIGQAGIQGGNEQQALMQELAALQKSGQYIGAGVGAASGLMGAAANAWGSGSGGSSGGGGKGSYDQDGVVNPWD